MSEIRVRAYESTTQATESTPQLRLSAMDGRATLTIEPSRVAMKVPMAPTEKIR